MYNFGPLAAQNDSDILSYFHTTAQVAELIAAHKVPLSFMFVARPGGGKTALVKWLESGSHSRSCIFVRPTQTQLVPIDPTEDDLNVEDYRILVSTELYAGVIAEALQRNLISGVLLKECKSYTTKDWLDTIKSFFTERFEGISVLGQGFSLKAVDRRNYLRDIKRSGKLDKSRDLVRRLAKEADITVVVDDPESLVGKGLKDVTPENAIRIGAFASVLNELHSLGVQVILFIKEHILQSVQVYYGDFSHFEDRIEGLEWTGDDLVNMLRLRVEKRLEKSWGEVFSIGEKAFQQELLPYLINGPRDLLFICNTAGGSGQKITKANLQKSVDALRTNKWAEIDRQYRTQWPRIDEFSRAITFLIANKNKIGDKPIPREKLRSLIEQEFTSPRTPLYNLRKEEKWIYTALWASPSIEERLFLIGCIGYVHAGQRFYPWTGRSLERFRLADALFVSPLFAQ